MVELNYLDITKTGEGHIKVPAKGVVAPAITESIAKTALASFADGAGGFPFKSLVGYINPVQSGTGDPSPSNVRPITGWTGMNVVVSPTLDAQDGTTYPISWSDEAGTVYGGYLDVVTGVLTVTMASVDLGTLTWGKLADYHFYTQSLSSLIKIDSNSVAANMMYEMGKTVPYTTSWAENGNIFGQTTGNVYIRNDSYTDAAAFKTAMSGVYLVYELATPVTYQLTPTEVTSILGTNNVWVDTNGDVECTYIADTKLYIDSKL